MPTVKLRATTILGELEQAQTELVGKAVILSDGKAGTVESVWLDEMHDCEFLSEATMGSGLSPPSNTCSRAEIGFWAAARTKTQFNGVGRLRTYISFTHSTFE